MVNVIYSEDSLTVLGGPEELQVDLNIGANGSRGGIFFTGNEQPNTLNESEFPSAPQIFDLYILTNPSSNNYLTVYQYVTLGTSNTWVESFKINSDYYFVNKVVSFSQGVADIEIDVTDVGIGTLPFTDNQNSFAYFNVQATISNINSELAPDQGGLDHLPAALSIKVGDAYEDTSGQTQSDVFPLMLPIELKAIEYSNGSWSDIDDKDVIVYFSINYVDPNEIIANLAGGES